MGGANPSNKINLAGKFTAPSSPDLSSLAGKFPIGLTTSGPVSSSSSTNKGLPVNQTGPTEPPFSGSQDYFGPAQFEQAMIERANQGLVSKDYARQTIDYIKSGGKAPIPSAPAKPATRRSPFYTGR